MTSYLDLLKQHAQEMRQAPSQLYNMLVQGMQQHAREDVAPMFERMNRGALPTWEQAQNFAMGPFSPIQLGGIKNITGVPQKISGVTKASQKLPSAANWEQVFSRRGPEATNKLYKKFMSLPPEKISSLHKKLNELGIRIKPYSKNLELVQENAPKPVGIKKTGGMWTVKLEGRRMGSGAFYTKKGAMRHLDELKDKHLDNFDKPIGSIESSIDGYVFKPKSGSDFEFVPGSDESLLAQIVDKQHTKRSLESLIDELSEMTIIDKSFMYK